MIACETKKSHFVASAATLMLLIDLKCSPFILNNSEAARYIVHSCKEYKISEESENILKINNLQRLNVIFVKHFFFKDESETISNQRISQKNISYDLKL